MKFDDSVSTNACLPGISLGISAQSPSKSFDIVRVSARDIISGLSFHPHVQTGMSVYWKVEDS